MLVWFSWIVVGIIYNLLHCYLFLKLTDKEQKWLTPKSVLLSIFFSLINCYAVYHTMVIRPIVVHICYVLILILTYRTSLSKTIIGILMLGLVSSIGEMITSTTLTTFFNVNLVEFNKTVLGVISCNIISIIFILIVVHIPKVKKWMSLFIKWGDNNKSFKTMFLSSVAMITLALLFKNNLIKWSSPSDLLITDIFIICVLIFVMMYLKENSDKNKLISRYDTLLCNVQTYEKLIIEKSKNQHEYRNQLIILKDLIEKKNKKALNYIDELLNINEQEINYNWLIKLNNIPQGGLKGLLYYKISQMQENGINVYVDINNNLESKNIWGVCDQHLKDVSRIVGVYIDNAIEAAIHSTKKYIIIEAELIDNDIIFTFSNTYEGNLDIDKMDSAGFTSKGKGKGYGLSLVSDILKKNNKLKQEREINGIYYVQKLIILK